MAFMQVLFAWPLCMTLCAIRCSLNGIETHDIRRQLKCFRELSIRRHSGMIVTSQWHHCDVTVA
jgi:hypothetical protein